jgi:hypothetical protein
VARQLNIGAETHDKNTKDKKKKINLHYEFKPKNGTVVEEWTNGVAWLRRERTQTVVEVDAQGNILCGELEWHSTALKAAITYAENEVSKEAKRKEATQKKVDRKVAKEIGGEAWHDEEENAPPGNLKTWGWIAGATAAASTVGLATTVGAENDDKYQARLAGKEPEAKPARTAFKVVLGVALGASMLALGILLTKSASSRER